jgi:hypothetical protein
LDVLISTKICARAFLFNLVLCLISNSVISCALRSDLAYGLAGNCKTSTFTCIASAPSTAPLHLSFLSSVFHFYSKLQSCLGCWELRARSRYQARHCVGPAMALRFQIHTTGVMQHTSSTKNNLLIIASPSEAQHTTADTLRTPLPICMYNRYPRYNTQLHKYPAGMQVTTISAASIVTKVTSFMSHAGFLSTPTRPFIAATSSKRR